MAVAPSSCQMRLLGPPCAFTEETVLLIGLGALGSSLIGPRTESPKCHGAAAAHLYLSVLAGHGQVGTVHLEHTLQECPGQQTGKVLEQEL